MSSCQRFNTIALNLQGDQFPSNSISDWDIDYIRISNTSGVPDISVANYLLKSLSRQQRVSDFCSHDAGRTMFCAVKQQKFW